MSPFGLSSVDLRTGRASGARSDLAPFTSSRLETVRLLGEQELNQSEVSLPLGAARRTVVPELASYRACGRRGLSRAEGSGRKPRFSAAEKAKLLRLLEWGPEALGLETPRWSCARVAQLVEQEFRVRYHPGHVWKILEKLGWSVQRVVGRARKRNEAAVRTGRRRRRRATRKPAGRGADRPPRGERT